MWKTERIYEARQNEWLRSLFSQLQIWVLTAFLQLLSCDLQYNQARLQNGVLVLKELANKEQYICQKKHDKCTFNFLKDQKTQPASLV